MAGLITTPPSYRKHEFGRKFPSAPGPRWRVSIRRRAEAEVESDEEDADVSETLKGNEVAAAGNAGIGTAPVNL